jgi:hypothetical protein
VLLLRHGRKDHFRLSIANEDDGKRHDQPWLADRDGPAVLLAGRWRLGWRGRTAARMLYAGSGLLLLAYVGSRFVMEALLQRT